MDLKVKISYFKEYLMLKDESYNDVMKAELYLLFFEYDYGFEFLYNLNSKEEINNKIDLLVHKMIMHEHEQGLNDIIADYLN